jgi:hypothetical protein
VRRCGGRRRWSAREPLCRFARQGHLAELFAQAGLREIEGTLLEVRLAPQERDRLRERCRSRLPAAAPFVLTASAWAARGRAEMSEM